MTKDEKGLEPPKGFWFQRNEDQSLSLEEAIGQAIGAGSMCWENPAGAGEFDSRRAGEIVRALKDWIEFEWFLNQTLERVNRANCGTEPKFSDGPT